MATISAADTVANHSRVGGGRWVTTKAAAWATITKITRASTTSSTIAFGQFIAYGKPIMFHRRYRKPTRAALARDPIWAGMRLWENCGGPARADGRGGAKEPAATPPARIAARLSWGRQSATSTITGTMAHASTAPAKPNRTPPQARRLVLAVIRSPSNTATAPARQNSTSHGSTSTVCAAATASA